jgi:hypothetical protein
MTSLRKKIFHSLQNIKLGRRTDRKHVPRLTPPDPSPLVAPVVLGRPATTEQPGRLGQGTGNNNYSGTPRQTSSDDTDNDDYDDYDDDEEELNFNLMSDVVYTSLRVGPQNGTEREEERKNKIEQDDDDSDESDDDTDDKDYDNESHVLEEKLPVPVVPIPAPRVSRLVQDKKEV